MLVLSLESSTSSSKALLYDTEKGVVDVASQPYDISICQNGKSDTVKVHEHIMTLAAKLVDGRDISAIAICGTWHSISVCDEALNPKTPTYSWNYTESSEFCSNVRKDKDLSTKLYLKTGCMPHITYSRDALRYLQTQGLDVTNTKLISQGGYTFYKLTGIHGESVSTACGFGLINVNRLVFDDFALQLTGLKKEQFGELLTYDQTFPLTKTAAAILGVKAGIPVVCAHPDGALNQIASFAATVGKMTLSIGTSGAIRMTTKEPVLPKGHGLWSYSGVVDYMSGAAISGACNCINWFMDDYLQNRWSFKELENVNDVVADTPVFLPFLFGERCPGWRDDRRAGFLNIKSNHSMLEMYRGLQAGILFNLYQCYDNLCESVAHPQEIIVSGGILNSKQWTQMLADIFGCTIRCSKNINASSIGAAVLASHAAGAIEDITAFRSDYDDAILIEPRSELREMYQNQYANYMDCYNSTQMH